MNKSCALRIKPSKNAPLESQPTKFVYSYEENGSCGKITTWSKPLHIGGLDPGRSSIPTA